MSSEKEKMLAGELYRATDPELVADHLRAQDLTVVGAGSVVVRDLPPRVIAVGNPCRVVRGC